MSALLVRYGSKRMTMCAGLAYCAALPLPGFAPSLPLLGAALVALGATTGAMDLSMNAQAVGVEKAYGRPILSSVHGMFSAGGIVGAGLGGLVAEAGIDPGAHLGATAALLAVVVLVAARALMDDSGPREPGPIFARPTGALVGLGVIAFCALMAEGAIADWSAVYLSSSLGARPGIAAAGFAFFSVAMTVSRLSGDRLTMRLGASAVVRAGGAAATVGMVLALAWASPIAAVAGFGLVGLGIASMFPLALSAAGRTPGMRSPVALAAVTSAGYTGLLASPPVIGLTAELTSLRAALGLVVACTIVAGLLARRMAVHED